MSPFADLLLHPATQSFLLLVTVVLLEKVWSVPNKANPLTLLSVIAENMGNKVNRKDNGAYQQTLAGLLAPLVLLAPLLMAIWLLTSTAEFPLFFDGLFLFLALQFRPVSLSVNKIATLLNQEKKSLAREALQKLVLRETQSLSTMGIAKASLETLCMRYCYQYTSVVFWFVLLGGKGALIYRVLLELHLVWNPKILSMARFGQPLHVLLKILQWFPVRLTLLATAIYKGPILALKGIRHYRPKSTHRLILVVFAAVLKVQLSGPVVYQQQKYRLARVGTEQSPRSAHIALCQDSLRFTTLIWLVASMLFYATVYAIK